ncbi:MAG: glycosyltransferase family 2 protein [Bryobacteraceae bacterium]|nr:glycosyltransferase family 2 protein [Bryobacteraceae bacterium]
MKLPFLYNLAVSRVRAEFRKTRRTLEWPYRRRAIERNIEVLRQAGERRRGPEEWVVTTVVREAEHLVEPYLEHYLRLGVSQIVLLDNGSQDDTVRKALECPQVTMLRCTLPFKHYDLEFKRFLIEEFGEGRWHLAVDIDERFDYPDSDTLPLPGLLRYLNRRQYTAMMATVLDMFPDGPPESWPEPGRRTINASVWYDLTGLCGSRILRLRLRNRFADPKMPFYRGGIHYQMFGIRNVATRFPLLYYVRGGRLNLNRIQHFCRGAHVADVSAVLHHYKFDRSFMERWRVIVQRGQHYGRAAIYRAGLETLEKNPQLVFRGPAARKLVRVNQLVDEGILRVSAAYRDHVRSFQPVAVPA